MPGKVGARVFGRWSCATFVVRYGKKFAGRPSAGRNRRLPRPAAESAGAGQNASLLFARRADVHVDFHAHLHFDDLRSFPGHWSLPRSSAQSSAGSNVRPSPARRKRFAFPQRNRLSHQAQHRAPASSARSHPAYHLHPGLPREAAARQPPVIHRASTCHHGRGRLPPFPLRSACPPVRADRAYHRHRCRTV